MGKRMHTSRTVALKRGGASETPLVDPNVEWTPEARVAGSTARENLLLAHAPLVKYLAHRIGGRLAGPIDFDDLVGDGLLGLMEAVDRFDPSHNVRFKTYAESRIRGAILDGVRARDWAPRSLRRLRRRLDDAVNGLRRDLGREPDEAQVAEAMGLTPTQYETAPRRRRASANGFPCR